MINGVSGLMLLNYAANVQLPYSLVMHRHVSHYQLFDIFCNFLNCP